MLTARAHVEYVARLRGTGGLDDIRDTIQAVALDPTSSTPARQFSLGMKQRWESRWQSSAGLPC